MKQGLRKWTAIGKGRLAMVPVATAYFAKRGAARTAHHLLPTWPRLNSPAGPSNEVFGNDNVAPFTVELCMFLVNTHLSES